MVRDLMHLSVLLALGILYLPLLLYNDQCFNAPDDFARCLATALMTYFCVLVHRASNYSLV